MSAHCVVLGDGARVSLGAYVRAWRAVSGLPADAKTSRGLGARWPSTAGDVLAEFRRGLADRINRHVPGYGKGRKWDADWQRATIQTARAVNTPRLIVRDTEVPLEWRGILKQRLTTRDDL